MFSAGGAIHHIFTPFIPEIWLYRKLSILLRPKTARLGGASAIQASLIAFGLHEPCSRRKRKRRKT